MTTSLFDTQLYLGRNSPGELVIHDVFYICFKYSKTQNTQKRLVNNDVPEPVPHNAWNSR